MKSKLFFFTAFLFASLPLRALAETARPIMASDIYNNLFSISNPGHLYIPLSTPLGNRAALFDNNNTLFSSVTTSLELSYLSGATSNIQAQLNAITGGNFARATYSVSANFTIPTVLKDSLVLADSSAMSIIIILPDAVAAHGLCADVKNIGVNVVTVSGAGGQTLDGNLSEGISGAASDIMSSKHYCAVNGNWFNF